MAGAAAALAKASCMVVGQVEWWFVLRAMRGLLAGLQEGHVHWTMLFHHAHNGDDLLLDLEGSPWNTCPKTSQTQVCQGMARQKHQAPPGVFAATGIVCHAKCRQWPPYLAVCLNNRMRLWMQSRMWRAEGEALTRTSSHQEHEFIGRTDHL